MSKVNAPLLSLALLLGSFLPCFAQTPISVGETKTGTLEASDSRREDCNGCIADRYQFTISSSQALVISLTSTDFDAFLVVRDSIGAVLATDDDSGGGFNSLISRNFAAGTYEIQASTFGEGETGDYALSLQAPTVTMISVGQTVSGTLTVSDARSVGCGGCFADLYEFSLSSSQALVITLDSTDFDAFLRVLDSSGSEVTIDDDGGAGMNSRISRTFEAGTYRIEATTFSSDEEGDYTLSLGEVPPPTVTPISVGETVSGMLTVSDGGSVGCFGCLTDLYEFTLSTSQDLLIRLDSPDFDAFLRVLDSSGETVVANDDGGAETNSRLLRTFAAGTYRIEATTFSAEEEGAYTLSLEEAPVPTVTPINVGEAASGTLDFLAAARWAALVVSPTCTSSASAARRPW